MSVFARLFPGLAARRDLTTRAADPLADLAPAGRAGHAVTMSEAPTIPAVHRAFHIITTAVTQLSLNVERAGRVLPDSARPPLVRRPNLDMSLSAFLEQTTLSLATTGNAYWLKHRIAAEIAELEPLNPHMVYPYRDQHNRRRFGYNGATYTPDEIQHLRLLTMPGADLGIGPVQAAQGTMSAARDMRDYSAAWFETGTPSGVLSSADRLTADDARMYRNFWNGLDEDGEPLPYTANPSRIRVLGKGLAYSPLMLSPKDAMWLEAQSFSVLEIARIFGVPSTLMLAALDGNSMTYSNVGQEWLGFVRFTLMKYLREIEEALTDLTARGQTVRFNIETLLRADTETRYTTYQRARAAGFMTVNEIRAIEGLPPLPGGDTLAPDGTTTPKEIAV